MAPKSARRESKFGFDPRMRVSLASVAAAGIALTLGALVVAGLSPAFSVAVGAALAVGNLWALARIIVALLPTGGERPVGLGGWAALGVLKMVALMGGVWLLMQHGIVAPLPLVVGFSALPIGIAIGAVVSDRSGAP